MSYLEAKSRLPEIAASRLLSDNSPILITKGLSGYCQAPEVDPDAFNAALGITPAQVEAMKAGSMFGWDIEGADPLAYESEPYSRLIAQHPHR